MQVQRTILVMEKQVRRASGILENGEKVFYLSNGFMYSLKEIDKYKKKGVSFEDLMRLSAEATMETLFEQAQEKGFEPIENEPIEVILSWTPDIEFTAIVRGAFKMLSLDFEDDTENEIAKTSEGSNVIDVSSLWRQKEGKE